MDTSTDNISTNDSNVSTEDYIIHHCEDVTHQNPEDEQPCDAAPVRPYYNKSWKVYMKQVPSEKNKIRNGDTDEKYEEAEYTKPHSKENPESEEDILPSTKWPPSFTISNLISSIMSMVFFLVDITSDWRLAIVYYINKEYTLFYLTVIFIGVPSVVASIISLVWSIMEYRHNKMLLRQNINNSDAESNEHLVCRVIFSVLQLGRCFRLMEYTWFVVKSWLEKDPVKEEDLRKKALQQRQDSAILGLVDGFLESALQFLLQLYLSMSNQITMDFLRVATLCLSWTSTAMLHTSFYRNNRKVQKKKKNVSYTGTFFYFMWRICELGPRFILLVQFAFIFKFWCTLPIIVHFTFMLGFYIWQKPELMGICCPGNKIFGYIFLILISYIGIFSYVNLTEGKTRKYISIYYIVFYVENIIMSALIILYFPSDVFGLVQWKYCAYIAIPGFICHIFFMSMFYFRFHPTNVKSSSSQEESKKICTNVKLCGIDLI